MTPRTFDFFAEFLKERSGLSLQKEKQYLLENRLSSILRSTAHESYDDLASAIQRDMDGPTAQSVVESMTVCETSFFRDRSPFDHLVQTVLPAVMDTVRPGRPIRIWSAAASSGQEAYTIAMLWKENAARFAGHKLEIVATDLSTAVLEKAKSGIYSQFEVQRGMPVQLLLKYFEQAGENWKLNPEIKSMVTFQPFNLLSSYAGMPQFDIIFCRNVLIYFDLETKSAVLGNLRNVITDDGYLFLGGAETTIGVTDKFVKDEGARMVFRTDAHQIKNKLSA